MAEDLSSLRQFRNELAELLQRVDDRITEVEDAQRLTPDDIRQRQLENASRLGETWAGTEDYSTPETLDALRVSLRDHFRGDEQLVSFAIDGARRAWNTRAA